MRDKASLNALLEGEETSGVEIDLAIDLAIDDFIETPPPVWTGGFDDFPSFSILLYGTVIEVLNGAGLLQSRNELNYVDGGISVKTSDKTLLYQRWLDRFETRYERMKIRWKKNRNLESCYGGVPSEYALAAAYGYSAYGSISAGDFGGGAGLTASFG